MITADVHQVTTQSQAQQLQWEIRDDVLHTAKKWTKAANQVNIDRMNTEMQAIGPSPSQPHPPIEQTDNDPV